MISITKERVPSGAAKAAPLHLCDWGIALTPAQRTYCSLLAVAVTIAFGCSSTPGTLRIPLIDSELPARPVARLPLVDAQERGSSLSVAEVAARHNGRVAGLPDLWAHAAVSLSWTHNDGQKYTDVFSGYMMLQRPSNVFLSLDKSGTPAVVAGSDDELFWIISLLDSPTVTWICRIENVGTERCQAPPNFLLPHELTLLTGLTLIPTSPTEYTATRTSQGVAISWSAGNLIRSLRFPADSWVPDRVTLADANGVVLAESRLGKYRPVVDEKRPEEQWTYAPGFIQVTGSEWAGEAVLQAHELRVRPRNRDAVGGIPFSFPHLRRAYPTEKLHVLDAECSKPAIINRLE